MGLGFEEASRLSLWEYQMLVAEHTLRIDGLQEDVTDEEWQAFNDLLSSLPGVKVMQPDEDEEDGRHSR